MTTYTTIYERFLNKIEDTQLALMSDDDREEMLYQWLMTALGYIEMDDLKMDADLSDRDEENKCFNEDLSNAEIEGIALFMVVAWYEGTVNSLEHTLLFMGSKDEKWTSQKDHWKTSIEIQDSYRRGLANTFVITPLVIIHTLTMRRLRHDKFIL